MAALRVRRHLVAHQGRRAGGGGGAARIARGAAHAEKAGAGSAACPRGHETKKELCAQLCVQAQARAPPSPQQAAPWRAQGVVRGGDSS